MKMGRANFRCLVAGIGIGAAAGFIGGYHLGEFRGSKRIAAQPAAIASGQTRGSAPKPIPITPPLTSPSQGQPCYEVIGDLRLNRQQEDVAWGRDFGRLCGQTRGDDGARLYFPATAEDEGLVVYVGCQMFTPDHLSAMVLKPGTSLEDGRKGWSLTSWTGLDYSIHRGNDVKTPYVNGVEKEGKRIILTEIEGKDSSGINSIELEVQRQMAAAFKRCDVGGSSDRQGVGEQMFARDVESALRVIVEDSRW